MIPRTKKQKILYLVILGLLLFNYNNCTVSAPDSFRKWTGVKGTEVLNPMAPFGNAALPKVFLNSDYPVLAPDHRVIKVGSNQEYTDCQAAEDAAQPGDEIVVDAGFVCKPITLRNKGPTDKYIVIRSSELSLLPPQGTRVSHADAAHMAIIETDRPIQAVATEPGSHHHQIVGFEIRTASVVSTLIYHLICFGSGSETSVAELPHDMVIARSWIHGRPDQEVMRGITLNGSAISIVDSVIDDIHRHGNNNAIAGWNVGIGPFKIVNNDISSPGQNFFVGGSQVTIPDLVPGDIEFRKNLVHKDNAWRQPITSNTGDAGYWGTDAFVLLQNVQRILIDGNIFEYNWYQTGSSLGMAIRMGPVGLGLMPWVRVQDVTFSNNIIRHSAGAFEVWFHDGDFPGAVSQRLDFRNNLIYDIGSQWGSDQPGSVGIIRLLSQASVGSALSGPVYFSHNTLLSVDGTSPSLMTVMGPIPQTTFVNNLGFDSSGGIIDSAWGTGAATLDKDFPGILFQANVLAGQNATLYSGYGLSNFFPASTSAVGFVSDPMGGVSDYHGLALLPSSPYHGRANDGRDIGAVISDIDSAL